LKNEQDQAKCSLQLYKDMSGLDFPVRQQYWRNWNLGQIVKT